MGYANFEVDPRLATLLGESYRSTELAIKELVDNAYRSRPIQVHGQMCRGSNGSDHNRWGLKRAT
jgi:hypothetical protein